MSLIIVVLMLGIIIIIHESDHFLLVKLSGVGVIEFSLGMGSRLFSFEKGGIQYSFRILPLGGSCMILGEDEGITNESVFDNRSVRAGISVVTAGPVFNFVLALGLSMTLIGITGYGTTYLAEVVDGYPAQAVGVEAGDVIRFINDRKVRSYRDISWYLFTHPRKPLTVTQERTEEGEGTERFSTELAPVFSMENNQYTIRAQFNPVPNTAENIGQLLVHSAYEVQYWIHYVFDTSYMMFHGTISVDGISGPAGIVNAIDTTADEAAPYGMSAMVPALVDFTIFLGANLGVMNLLPIPALDGRRLVFFIVEAVREKPIDKEKEDMVHMVGMMVLLTLIVLILFNGIRKLS